MKNTTVRVGILLLVALSHLGHADTMRCGDTGPVVSSGDTTADVLAKCGAPTQREKRQECREPAAGRRPGSIPCDRLYHGGYVDLQLRSPSSRA